MTEQDRAQFAAIMGGLAENFNGKLSGPGLDMRFAALSEFSIEQVNAAAMACVRSRKFSCMPTIAEIIEHIEGSKEDHKVEGETQARQVLEAARRHGVYATVRFADPVTNAVVRQFLGGWANVCATKEEAHTWFVKDFSERYAEYKQRGVEDVEPLRGIGTSNMVELVGGQAKIAIEGDTSGQKKVAALVGGATFQQRQKFREGAPFHELVRGGEGDAA